MLDIPLVSIQLMSPASGDYNPRAKGVVVRKGMTIQVSIQLMSPASGDME